MACYLVTGGGGFIGSNLTEALLKRGEVVRVLDDFSTGRRQNLTQAGAWAAAGSGEFALLEGDIRDPHTCRAALDGVDYVLHQAAVPSVPRSVQDPLTTHAVNVDGTLYLLEAARQAGVRRFVFASSSSIYGESETLPKVETMPAAPISPYGLQKLAAETYCRLYHRLYGLPTIALRYFNVFGPRQDPTSEYSAVIARFVTAARTGGRPIIFGDGEQSRDFTFVADAVRANLLSCSAEPTALGGTYNIGCGSRHTLNDLVRNLAAISGRELQAEHRDPRPGDIRHSLADIDQARRRLGFEPTVPFLEGLRRTFEAA